MSTNDNRKVGAHGIPKMAVSVLLFISLLFSPVVTSYSDDVPDARTIKVGYMNHPGFIERAADGRYYGYGVEYLDEICEYTGWEIEYLYAPWLEQLDMLERGELDIVPMARYSAERAERFSYVNQPIGLIQSLLLVPKGEQNDIQNDAIALDGKTIGIQRGSRNLAALQKHAERLGFTYSIVEFDYQSQLENALLIGDIDIIACEQMISSNDFQILDRIGSDPFYFITAKGNSDLMDELNYTISIINAYEPTFVGKLYQRYFGEGLTGNRPYFTKAETEFIQSCGEIEIAMVADNKPEAYIDDDGKLTGIIPDTMNLISELCGIDFNYSFIPEGKAPLDFIIENPDCIVGGVLVSNPAYKASGVLLSDVYFTTYSSLAVHKKNAESLDPHIGNHTIAIPASFQTMHYFIADNYPNLTVLDCLTVAEGLQALENGQADFFAYTDNIIQPYLSNPIYADIRISDSRFMENPHCNLGINSPKNKLLLGIIDKCISLLPKDKLAQMENEHIQQSMYRFSESDALHRYRDSIVLIALIVMGAFAILVTLLFIRQYRYARDITHSAEYDMMTGVYNRVTLKAKIQAIDKSSDRCCAFMIIDVDDLKHINDSMGHSVGDEAIKGIAGVIKSLFRDSAIIGRVGGDEFGVFISGFSSKSMLVSMLARLQTVISSTPIANSSVTLTASIGVTIAASGNESPDELFNCADEALSRVKSSGKNGFAFYESLSSVSLSTPAASCDNEALEDEPSYTAIDAPERHIADAALDAGDSNFRMLVDSSPNISVYVIEEATHKVLFYNKRFKKICPNIKLGMSCRSLGQGPCQNCIVDSMGKRQMAHTVYYSGLMGDDVDITAVKLLWDNAIPAVMVNAWSRNLTGSDSRMSKASSHDAYDYITGGLTRAGFIHMMERMQKGGVDLTEYAVLFINIKDFKAVNELVGSTGGDNLLCTLFTRLEQSALHPIIGARKESDHFVLLVEKSLLDLRKLPDLLNFQWKYGCNDMFIHCRCGVFMIEDGTLEVYKMIDRAKLAKEHIVDDYVQPYAVYDPSMLEEYSERASAFLLFDEGIKNNEFVVYYQPIVDAKTERIVSAEALVRRKTADGTIISPGKFIPILERTGYISMLDRFVAMDVSKFLNRRMSKGLKNVPISFNLSQKDFYDAAFMELLATKLENSKLPKGLVMLEITESAYTMHEKKHEEYMSRLRASGAKILLDDFGTGYSSFGMFENYNFDRVKLDMSFVRRLHSNQNVKLVIESIIAMCHKLGVHVVAEGVETEDELAILRGMDCDFIQGYYFSKPLDEKNFEEYISKHY